jgi:hypothetical protein
MVVLHEDQAGFESAGQGIAGTLVMRPIIHGRQVLLTDGSRFDDKHDHE